MKIILDVMGSDNGCAALVEGAVQAGERYGCDMVLVGDKSQIDDTLIKLNQQNNTHIEIVHATSVVTMEDEANAPVRSKKDSSLAVALTLLAEGKGDSLVSAANTGAVLMGATLIVKRIKGVRRGALVPILPTAKGGAVLIDCGANVECSAEYLVQFAHMGAIYASGQLGIKNPRVALVNNGVEAHKGPALYVEAYKQLEADREAGKMNFIGNVEGRDVPLGHADVVVCDGFTGNILLKTMEGVAMYLVGEIKGMFMASLATKLAAVAMKPQLKAFKKKMDYTEVGGAPLLGIAKPIIKAHGSSNANAFRSAIGQAIEYANSGVIEKIAEIIK